MEEGINLFVGTHDFMQVGGVQQMCHECIHVEMSSFACHNVSTDQGADDA
jgi:hypothetical protein